MAKEYIKSNVVLDDDSYASSKIKRPFNTSQLLRWMLKVLMLSEKEIDKLLVEDEEFQVVQDYMRPKLRKVLGMPDIETEVQKKRREKLIKK